MKRFQLAFMMAFILFLIGLAFAVKDLAFHSLFVILAWIYVIVGIKLED